MSGLRHVRTNQSPPLLKKTAGPKTARSAPGVSQKISSKSGKPRKPKRHEEEGEEQDEILGWNDADDSMATTFLQYW